MTVHRFLGAALLVACGGTATVADDVGSDASSGDGKADSRGPCDGLGCAIGPGKLILHVVDSQFMQPIASPTFTENGQMLQPTCIMGDSGACSAWQFAGLFIGGHTIVVHAPNALDATLMVTISGPTGCCGFGPDVDKTVVMSTLSPNNACTSTGGTIEMRSCCSSSNDFPDLCLTGACGCSPQNSKMIQVCACPQGKCYKPNIGCM
ncbi:MAG TPA: hypothetical protein VFJ20_10055 [Gemmatimonadaceae bacterium]|nr:hypothetical protein [Gemmatimonadaceae bacterium]